MGYFNTGRCERCGATISPRPRRKDDARYCGPCEDHLTAIADALGLVALATRATLCDGCPFKLDRTGPPLDAEDLASILRRIEGGEQWICHSTCDGPRVTSSSLLCAGAAAGLPLAGY